MTIITIYGNKGQGKSAIATYIAYMTLERAEKSQIVANYKLNFPYISMNFRQLESYQNALVVFDEAHIYVDNRSSQKKLNKLISYFVYEIRHLNTDLIEISQQESIDKRLRAATDIILLPHAYVYDPISQAYRDKIDDNEPIDVIVIDSVDVAHDKRIKKFYLPVKDLGYDLFSLYDPDALIPFSSDSLDKFL